MKKSTKIILIASGSVILVSVILIVVFAYVIKAQTISQPTPNPGNTGAFNPAPTGSASNCPLSTLVQGQSGVTLQTPTGTLTPAGSNNYNLKLNWSYNGVAAFMGNIYGDKPTDQAKNYAFTGFVQIIKYNSSGQTINSSGGGGFSSGQTSWSESVSLNTGEYINVRVIADLCWLPKGYAVPLTRKYQSDSPESYSGNITGDPTKPTNFNLDQNNTPPTSTSSSSQICGDSPNKYIKPLDYISYEMRCAMYGFSAGLLQWSYKVMIYYAGLTGLSGADSTPPKFQIDNSGSTTPTTTTPTTTAPTTTAPTTTTPTTTTPNITKP
jgi:hypothetical protein